MRMSRLLGGVMLGFCGSLAQAEIVVDSEDFILRQQWPWSGLVSAVFQVRGAVTPPGAMAQVKAYDGDTFICDIPNSALTGDSQITSIGLKRLSFDPSKIPALAARGVIKNFRLGVEYVDGTIDYNDNSILYVVFDLEKNAGEDGFLQVLTESDITGGSTEREGTGIYGAWKRKYWGAGADTVAWLGVNTDVYKTTKLVLRHVPAQTFMMGSPDDEPGRLPNDSYNAYADQVKAYGLEDRHTVTLSSYYIGVFELTQKQWALIGATRANSNGAGVGNAYPANNITYAEIRGDVKPYNAVTDNSFMGLLKKKVGSSWTADLPSEAQWEAACRAGTDTGVYDGTELPTNLTYYTLDGRSKMKNIQYDPLAQLAVYFNGGDRSTDKVGLKFPNNYGLYDMLGNVGEICLDRLVPNTGLGTTAATDPVYTTSGDNRAMRGGTSDNWTSYNYGLAPYRSAARASITYNSYARQLGFRVAMKPASTTE